MFYYFSADSPRELAKAMVARMNLTEKVNMVVLCSNVSSTYRNIVFSVNLYHSHVMFSNTCAASWMECGINWRSTRKYAVSFSSFRLVLECPSTIGADSRSGRSWNWECSSMYCIRDISYVKIWLQWNNPAGFNTFLSHFVQLDGYSVTEIWLENWPRNFDLDMGWQEIHSLTRLGIPPLHYNDGPQGNHRNRSLGGARFHWIDVSNRILYNGITQ